MRILMAAGLLGLSACGGDGGGSPPPPPPPPPANAAPTFTSPAAASVPENATGAVYQAVAADPEGASVTYSIQGGADAAAFAIDAAGRLTFARAPDFELPADANRNNVYDVILRASDGALSSSLTLALTVANVTGPVATRRVGTGFSQPTFLTALADGSGRLLVTQKGGLIRVLDPRTGAIAATPFLDLTGQIATDGEQGLLGLALAPDFAASGVFYVQVSGSSGTAELRRYRTVSGARDRADGASADLILAAPSTPFTNHKGGWIGFGPDGLLHVATGDGGGAGDPLGNGQNRATLYGKILRIDVGGDAFPADPARDYAIPSTNPFAAGGGAPEVWQFGLRNPWRASFDRAGGAFFIGDVGQGAREEIDLVRPGEHGLNFGWNVQEGTQPFAGGATAGLAPPAAEYAHGSGPLQGRSVTGGYVYRGPIASFAGQYLFGDFVNRRMWSFPASSATQGSTLAASQFTDRTASFAPDTGTIGQVVSFGEDDLGNVYVIDFDGEIFVVAEREP